MIRASSLSSKKYLPAISRLAAISRLTANSSRVHSLTCGLLPRVHVCSLKGSESVQSVGGVLLAQGPHGARRAPALSAVVVRVCLCIVPGAPPLRRPLGAAIRSPSRLLIGAEEPRAGSLLIATGQAKVTPRRGVKRRKQRCFGPPVNRRRAKHTTCEEASAFFVVWTRCGARAELGIEPIGRELEVSPVNPERFSGVSMDASEHFTTRWSGPPLRQEVSYVLVGNVVQAKVTSLLLCTISSRRALDSLSRRNQVTGHHCFAGRVHIHTSGR